MVLNSIPVTQYGQRMIKVVSVGVVSLGVLHGGASSHAAFHIPQLLNRWKHRVLPVLPMQGMGMRRAFSAHLPTNRQAKTGVVRTNTLRESPFILFWRMMHPLVILPAPENRSFIYFSRL